jgi:hypothetical protein
MSLDLVAIVEAPLRLLLFFALLLVCRGLPALLVYRGALAWRERPDRSRQRDGTADPGGAHRDRVAQRHDAAGERRFLGRGRRSDGAPPARPGRGPAPASGHRFPRIVEGCGRPPLGPDRVNVPSSKRQRFTGHRAAVLPGSDFVAMCRASSKTRYELADSAWRGSDARSDGRAAASRKENWRTRVGQGGVFVAGEPGSAAGAEVALRTPGGGCRRSSRPPSRRRRAAARLPASDRARRRRRELQVRRSG